MEYDDYDYLHESEKIYYMISNNKIKEIASYTLHNKLPEDALRFAVSVDSTEIAKWLINNGMDIMYSSKHNNCQPLYLALTRNNNELLTFMIKRKKNIVNLAIKYGIKHVKKLINLGATTDYKDNNGNNLLHIAIKNSIKDYNELLYLCPQLITLRNNNGLTSTDLNITYKQLMYNIKISWILKSLFIKDIYIIILKFLGIKKISKKMYPCFRT